MPKKVMFFLPTLGGGGAERTVIQLANSFVEQELDIDLVVCNLQGEKSKLKSEISSKINLIDLDCGRVVNAILPLKKLLLNFDYDILISTQTHSNIVCGIAKKIAKVQTKLIFREVSTPSKNMNLSGFKKTIFQFLVKWTYTSAQDIVCVSNGVLKDFKKYYNYSIDNLITIYNPVLDDKYFEKLTQPVNHHFFSEANKVILAIGRLTEAKNFKLLINAFSKLQRNYPETRLIILGEGELRSNLEDLIVKLNLNHVIDLPGFDSNPYAFFKYSSLFVLSSNWEGLPGVLIQALASKVKIVSTNCPSGPMEILKNSQYGILVECNNQKAMVEAMESAIFGKYVQFSEEAFEQHCQQFYKHRILQSYLDLMKQSI